MKKIKLITDSGSDLNQDLIDKYDIKVIPIPVKIGKDNYKDGENITPQEFYQYLNKSDKNPVTSMINPYIFETVFSKVLEEYDQIIYISFSSELSGIYNSAKIAQNNLNLDRITVIDSKAASFGLGLLVLEAAQALDNNKTKEEVIAQIEQSIEQMEHIFAVGSLEMLKRGGRISSTKALVGSLLNITPVLEVNKEGKIVPLTKLRGKKRFLNYMIRAMQERGTNISEQIIGISHADNLELAEQLADKIRKTYGIKEIIITQIGAAIGSHTGPGTLILFFK